MVSTIKCSVCNKKANGLGIICKCGLKFCMEHRMPEEHNCTFDFKTYYQKKILESLTTSVCPKFVGSQN